MLRIIFFGTPPFSKIILDALAHHRANIVAVVTKPDKPAGRDLKSKPSPVKESALSHGYPCLEPSQPKSREFLEELKAFNPDLFVVASFSLIFNEALLSLPRKGCINVHPSLLPKYRGAAPIERSLMAGEKKTGVTIMSMASEIDAGDMLAQEEIEIGPEMNRGELIPLLAEMGGRLLIHVLEDLEKGTLKKVPQSNVGVILAPKIKPEDQLIDWSRPALQIHNQIRALSPKPGAYAWVVLKGQKKRLSILKSRVEILAKAPPGTLLSEKGLVVGAGENALRLLEIQLEGKRAMPVDDFLRGVLKEELSF